MANGATTKERSMDTTCGVCKIEFPTLDEVFSHDCTGTTWNTMPAQRRTPPKGATATEKQVAFLTRLTAERPMWASVENLHADRIRVMSKSDASYWIDQALKTPVESTPDAGPRMATEKQMGLLRKLIDEKDLSTLGDSGQRKVNYFTRGNLPTAAGASAFIDTLLALPDQAARVVEAGVYTCDETCVTYRVYLGQQSGKMLAAGVVEHGDGTAEFVYEGQADRLVTDSFRKLTIEEAARFGRATGTCIVCARRLDVPESVDRGIGPVCYGKMVG
jgi:hypothetical protein